MKETYYRKGRHSVTGIYVHLVFVTKYRKKILSSEHIEFIEEVCTGVAKKMGFKLIQLNGEAEHVHCLIEYPPKLSVSQIVNSLKGVSSRMLRKEYQLSPHTAHIWSPSYFAVSCGGAPIAKIKKYIENQNITPFRAGF
ncbi:transposase [Xenococcus sp. PCC 7305]|uniref:IS200/IS605 family transposase n=1 Tax=Xenococcus sp. PCC 7305 TaxID=102125 RepID=UPI0002AC38E7|nr:IS200/IS605 family transposase [Xenococcus sp. PCC 7305]ELS04527.1 transposase [Xenococcus sp. PCC 7305]